MSKRTVVVLAVLAAVVVVVVFLVKKFTTPSRVRVGEGSLIIDNVDYAPLGPNPHWKKDPFDLHTTGAHRIATITQQADGCPSAYNWCAETPLCNSECEVDIQYTDPSFGGGASATLAISSSASSNGTHMTWHQNPPDPTGTGFQDTGVWNAAGTRLTFRQFPRGKITAITVAGVNHINPDPTKHNQIWVSFH
jgi:hypothetical protein